jgi:YfiH family protein
MSFHETNGLRYYRFEIFSDSITQAVFTRRGGVSSAPWHSLNLGGSVGDDPKHVAENRIRVFNSLGRTPESIHDVWLIHSTDIVYADSPRPLDGPPPRADIIFTDNPDVTLFMRFGDCVPILLHDPVRKVIGVAHAGWLGTLQGVVGAAVRGMSEHYGCHPKDIVAGIGPSIGIDHYEVGAEVISQFREKYPQDADQILQSKNGSTHLDLWASNELQLRRAGVEQVQVSNVCTACHVEDWFSHRAEKGKTGRFGALMALQS